MPASTFQSESFQKMLVIGVQAKDLHLLFIKNYYKVMETRSHTDGFQRNNAKCLDEKGISRFVPHSSI